MTASTAILAIPAAVAAVAFFRLGQLLARLARGWAIRDQLAALSRAVDEFIDAKAAVEARLAEAYRGDEDDEEGVPVRVDLDGFDDLCARQVAAERALREAAKWARAFLASCRGETG